MKNLWLFSICCIMLLALTSCFEIREEITWRADGSGHAMLLANFSESKSTIDNFVNRGEVQGRQIPSIEQAKDKLQELENYLSTLEGVHAVKIIANYTDYIGRVQFDFDDAAALNNAINQMAVYLDEGKGHAETADNFSYSNGVFQRLYGYSFQPMSENDYQSTNVMIRMIAETARIVQKYQFSKPVAQVSNEKAVLSPSRTSIHLKHTLSELMTGKSDIETRVTFE